MGNQRYYLSIDDVSRARGPVPSLSFDGDSPEAFGATLQSALRESTLFERWRALQDDPDDVPVALAATDATATVTARPASDLRVDVQVTTSLPHVVLRHRLNLLAGSHWSLRDVKAA